MKKKRIVILGAGETGVGTALLAKGKLYDVFVSDKQKIGGRYKTILMDHDIAWEEETHTESKILTADVVVKSPGIPEHVDIVKIIRSANISIISEIEFASKYINPSSKIIGITGSNGKTTTALLTHALLKQDINIGLSGNIGNSFSKQVLEGIFENYVLELSSFQLDDIVDFKPHIAVLLNITPDHLDRYNYDFEAYIASKFKIIKNQTEDDYLIYDADDEVITNYLNKKEIASKLLPFSLDEIEGNGAYLKEDNINITIDNTHMEVAVRHFPLQGKHNLKNAMAATTIAHLLKIKKPVIKACLENFQGVAHRLEQVLKIRRVQYINDSKATNVNSTYYALETMKSPTVWIAGGVDKGNDYEQLFPFVNTHVKAIICLGVDNRALVDTFEDMVDTIVETQHMEEAVKMAYHLALPGDNVLLSPACASFDLFKNYEDRGNQFKEAVRNL